MEDRDEFIQIKELKEWLRISRSQSYELLKSEVNPLPAYRIGGTIRVKREDVEQWLEANKYQLNKDIETAKANNGNENNYDAHV